ncbi:putative Photosystem II reaction center W protein, chloroplastic [Cocos nucifera]|uniref:PSII 6.1 kDa protein n=1 Tax=Cocos nucifera TaxID=13894 RepID=A0A8K0I8J4_COCNU|nr:putative Photosystem II reaction center W protein, chloroplastic [Cocos nucifera]
MWKGEVLLRGEAIRRQWGMGVSLLAAASVMCVSNPVLALVDDRMSTEGTGLSLGISNNLLGGGILLGVFGLIWALYFVYTSTLEEDEESGLSL